MVYNWDDKEADCYRLYVEQRKSLDEVIAYWEPRGFTPSKRAFQTQFRRWDFPSKRNPAHRNPALIARLHELWEQNYTQKDMVDTLQDEGYQISDRELIRLRLRLKLLLRESVPRPKRKQSDDGVQKPEEKASGNGIVNQLANAILAEPSSSSNKEPETEDEQVLHALHEQPTEHTTNPAAEAAPLLLDTEDVLRKQLRQEQLQLESDEKWRTRKRRRRTRGWAGLPPDAPGEPPRFPSETTIDEAKAYLGLDNDMYRRIRERFFDICKEHNVIKKTMSGPEKWAQIVQKLIGEDAHLSTLFEQEPEALQSNDALFRPKGQRALSLDVICMDVTKRLRTMESRMTLAEAKNALCLNPEQTRLVRTAFSTKLQADQFTNKLEAGEEHWAALKTTWVNESEHLARALVHGEADPEYPRKLKAVEVLARDVMKRQQQDKCKNNPSKKEHKGPGPGPAPPLVASHASSLRNKDQLTRKVAGAPDASQTAFAAPFTVQHATDLQIDPSLLLAASDAAILPTTSYPSANGQLHGQAQYESQRRSSPSFHSPGHDHDHYHSAATSTSSMPRPVYFRLHPHSTTPFPTKTVWLAILHEVSVAELGDIIASEHPGSFVHRIEGIIIYRGGQHGRDVTVVIGDDEELEAYLGHVRGEGGSQGKATFVVLLGPDMEYA
ncbi:hypothetical protein ACN47E_002299 [Coniothyrium glycines]